MRHLICIFIENSKFLNYVHLSSRICSSKIYSGVGGTEQVIFFFFLEEILQNYFLLELCGLACGLTVGLGVGRRVGAGKEKEESNWRT